MVEQFYRKAQDGEDIRTNLSNLRREIKQADSKTELLKLVESNPDAMIAFLSSEDAKTRKNAALLMGELQLEAFKMPLFEAYQKETQLFVRASYLTALRNFDIKEFIPVFKQRMHELTELSADGENKKHYEEELHELTELLVSKEGIKPHKFCGFKKKQECILLTNRLHREVTKDQIAGGEVTLFAAGLRVKNADIKQILPIRTYSELLFVIPQMHSCVSDPLEAAKQIADSELLTFLTQGHSGTAPFYFRMEVKSKMEADKKSQFIKKLTTRLETLTNRQLINSASNYEFEIRLIEDKDKNFNALVKLYTIKDERFDYRKESVAASMKPVNAALLVELSKEYMVQDAQVLDPFCGVGTLLIERQKVIKANTSYGIDIYEEAIKKAKINTQAAGQIIHYVNKDCFQFDHEYLFDEIFTDMPFATGHKSEEEICDIYFNFFRYAKYMLKDDGTVIMYTHDKKLVVTFAEKLNFKIINKFEIMNKEGTWLFVLKSPGRSADRKKIVKE